MVTDFDVEIRMFDNSLNIKHLATCRMLGKLLMMRAAELSTYGTWIFRDTAEWKGKTNVIRRLNEHRFVDRNDENAMRGCAKELYVETEHLMTQKEKSIFMDMLRNPLWKNGKGEEGVSVANEGFDALECLLTTKGITASTRQEYYEEVARLLNATPDTIREKLSRLKAKWNKDTGTYSIEQ